LTDNEYRAFQWYRLLNPEAGDLVRGNGGVRKVRWAPEGKDNNSWTCSKFEVYFENIGRKYMMLA
jgi:hypothetical protein